MALSDEIKARVSLRALAEQTVAWDAHKSNPKRGDYWAPCPFHGEATASFHVTEPKGKGGTFYCFGCQEKGSVIDYLMARDGLGFTAALRALADAEHIDRDADPARAAKVKADAEARQREAEVEASEKAAQNHHRAAQIWRASVANHPALIGYLTARGIDLGAIGGVPPTLRLHPDLPCYDGGKRIWRGPAMVGFIGRQKLLGIHRTWIDPGTPCRGRARLPDGRKVPKQMLGRTGEIFGAPVVLAKGSGVLLVGEGIETTLAALATARQSGAKAGAEAALSLGALCGPADNTGRGMKKGRAGKPLPSALPDHDHPRPGWLPPNAARRVIILADPSTKCPETARLNAERAQAKIAPHCTQGARLAIPRGHWDHDDDFADIALKQRSASATENAKQGELNVE